MSENTVLKKKNKNSSIPVKEELVERVATPLDRVNRVLSLLYTYLRVVSLQVIYSSGRAHIRLDPGLLCLLPGRWGHGFDHVLVTLFLIGHRHGPFDPGLFFLALLRKSINSR